MTRSTPKTRQTISNTIPLITGTSRPLGAHVESRGWRNVEKGGGEVDEERGGDVEKSERENGNESKEEVKQEVRHEDQPTWDST